MKWYKTLLFFFFCGIAYSNNCNLSPDLLKEIKSYDKIVTKIVEIMAQNNGAFYKSLTEFTDNYGHRVTGSKVLNQSLSYIERKLVTEKLVPILEPVEIPVWVRGKEKAHIIYPNGVAQKLKIMSLGLSPGGTVSGELLVVKDFEELEKNKVAGSIVLFNAEYLNSDNSSIFQNHGPAKASKLGAVGVLVRSLTPFSIGSIHTGSTFFGDEKPIPAATVTLEDADFLSRLFKSVPKIKIELKIKRPEMVLGISNNLYADIKGAKEKDYLITLSGHIDNWDIGRGALDNAGGAFLALHSLLLLKKANFPPPRRTIRAILWTGHEQGMIGVKSYAKTHEKELDKWLAAIESDSGLFMPKGFKIAGNNMSKCILSAIAEYISPRLNTTLVVKKGEVTKSDMSVLRFAGIPIIEPLTAENKFMWFQKSEGDSMRVMNSTYMDRHLAMVSITAYILADLSIPLPKTVEKKETEKLTLQLETASEEKNVQIHEENKVLKKKKRK